MSTIPVSTAPTAVANLLTAIKAQPAVTSPADNVEVLVQYGPPGKYEPNLAICVTGVRRNATPHAMVGNGFAGYLEETYTILLEVGAFVGGNDVQALADTRAWALVAAVETAVRSDLTLGGAVLEAYPSGADDVMEWDPDNRGRRSVITVQVFCRAVL